VSKRHKKIESHIASYIKEEKDDINTKDGCTFAVHPSNIYKVLRFLLEEEVTVVNDICFEDKILHEVAD